MLCLVQARHSAAAFRVEKHKEPLIDWSLEVARYDSPLAPSGFDRFTGGET